MPRLLPTTTYWRLQAAGWIVYGGANLAVARWGIHLSVLESIGQGVALGGIGLVLSHLIAHQIWRRALLTQPVRTRIAWTVALSLLLGVPTGILAALAGIAPWQTAAVETTGALWWIEVLAIHVVNWTALLLAWSAVYFVLRSVREHSRAQLRESELARALQLAQLRLLEAQLNPHFLFNVLNTVRSLILLDPALAQEAVTRLARTLRYSLSSGREDLVPLERELTMVDDYLAIEALRLEDRLSLTREISPSTLGVQIPVMLLQMLVENAIKHGIAELPEGGQLRIAAEIAADTLILTVENTRPLTSSTWRDPDSIGLQNCRQRLDLLFGPRASVTLDVTQSDRAIARVSLPCAP